MKTKKTIRIIGVFILISTASIISVQAADNDDTTISVYVETSGDVNASFNATAGGNVTYWIDGIEVKGEFESIWDAIAYYEKEISTAQATADYACFVAQSNSNRLDQDEKELEEHNHTLIIHYSLINDTITNLLILRDEVIGFEKDYLNYVNKTDTTLEVYGENLQAHEEEIATLKNKVSELTFILTLIEIILIVSAVSAIALYFINKRYPLKQLIKNHSRFSKDSYRQYKLVDFLQKTEYTKKHSILRDKIGIIGRIRIRRKPEKSPLKNLFSFLLLIKGGKKQ